MAVSPGAGECPLLDACARRPLPRPPVWFMRQAGRVLPEYREIRSRHSLLDICADPALAAEVTLQPVRRFDVDAAIIFADILLPIVPLGFDLRFVAGEGPAIDNRIEHADDVDRLRDVVIEDALAPTLEAIRIVRAALPPAVALIGFAGAPFTVASYLIEGGPSRSFVRTRRFMHGEPRAFARLLATLAQVTAAYLRAQIHAGAQVVQLFDSWAGNLSPADYVAHVRSHSAAVFAGLAETGAPALHFGTATGGLLEAMRDAGGDGVGVDWRIPLDVAWRRIGYDRCIQGNLDPGVLLAPAAEIERQVDRVLAEAGGRPGHIFNLGHGLLPETPVDAVCTVVERVRARGA